MYSFFGLFADPVAGLQEKILHAWPDLVTVSLKTPLPAIAVRFGTDRYTPSDEDMPDNVIADVQKLSAELPTGRFLLLRTECYGGPCANWGHVYRGGRLIYTASGEQALRRLLSQLDANIEEGQIFPPLARDFPWPGPSTIDT